MSKAADKPEVVQLPAEPPIAAPVSNRRAAAQRVREARDRLTSTSGSRASFDRELLRQYAQTRISASFGVMLLVVATGLLFGFWMQPKTEKKPGDRKSTRLNSSHRCISYAVFFLKKKKKTKQSKQD